MGGDEVYPAAARDDYKYRMENPYRYAFPNSTETGADHPSAFLIPGNHDWYDGLSLFLAKFCSGTSQPLGSWKVSRQHRSYFSIKLLDNWWIWGFDSQVNDADIDKPQAEYFTIVAKGMPSDPKIILCASVPSWLKAEVSASDPKGKEEFYRGLDFIAEVAINNCKGAKFYSVLSGDTHNYNRYSDSKSGTQFVTSGGGGAFLHPTHHLKDNLTIRWLQQLSELSLKTTPSASHTPSDKEACYPNRGASRDLVSGNLKFPFTNWSFCLFVGGVYLLAAILLSQDNSVKAIATDPVLVFLTAALGGCFWLYADTQDKLQKTKLTCTHSALHLAAICGLKIMFFHINSAIGLHPSDYWYFWLFMVEMVGGGFVGGLIWGMYLIYASWRWGVHHNDAFSAMQIKNYRHFLRIRLKGDELAIYPIGLDEVPNRDGWQINPNAREGNQNEPVFIPKKPLRPILIEGPIIIHNDAILKAECVAAETQKSPC